MTKASQIIGKMLEGVEAEESEDLDKALVGLYYIKYLQSGLEVLIGASSDKEMQTSRLSKLLEVEVDSLSEKERRVYDETIEKIKLVIISEIRDLLRNELTVDDVKKLDDNVRKISKEIKKGV